MARGVRRHPPSQRQLLVQRSSLMIDLGLVIARLLHYAAVTTLAGVSFFPLYAYADPEPIMLLRWRQGMLLAVIVPSVISIRLASTASPTPDWIMASLTGALLASLAGVGHSQIEEGVAGVIHVTSDAAHLLAAGAWLGGLLPLGFMLLCYGRETETARATDIDEVLLRFSGMGYIAVATLVGSGLINGWFLIGNVSGLFG